LRLVRVFRVQLVAPVVVITISAFPALGATAILPTFVEVALLILRLVRVFRVQLVPPVVVLAVSAFPVLGPTAILPTFVEVVAFLLVRALRARPALPLGVHPLLGALLLVTLNTSILLAIYAQLVGILLQIVPSVLILRL
jgi:hypothetical protein